MLFCKRLHKYFITVFEILLTLFEYKIRGSEEEEEKNSTEEYNIRNKTNNLEISSFLSIYLFVCCYSI